ncbi:phosphotransferase [Streptomyces sp. CA-111067]|uniref:phosphotransferase n=1 Tax=Streptomyces sp. CA-111067 TaxID=3240046 RepID=UPI003D97CDE3
MVSSGTEGHVRPGGAADDLPFLAGVFGLGEVHDVRYLAEGLMNRNWRVRTARGEFALKLIVDVPVVKARRSLGVLQPLAAAGLPVCAPCLTAAGDALAEIDGRSYCLLPWAAGVHRPGTTLDLNEAARLGVLLGEVHRSLAIPEAALPPAAEVPRAKVTAPESALAEADRFQEIIARLDEPSPFDLAAATALRRRKELIAEWAGRRPAVEVPRGPVGWTHGDFQHLNLLWRGPVISAVLDWDRLGVRPYAEEAVRSAQVQFGTEDGRLDLGRVAAFVSGYRSVVPVSDADLADAAERLWWKRMSDFWQLQWHYDKDDHGPDRLWVSGERLLEWWTGSRDVVRDAFIARS